MATSSRHARLGAALVLCIGLAVPVAGQDYPVEGGRARPEAPPKIRRGADINRMQRPGRGAADEAPARAEGGIRQVPGRGPSGGDLPQTPPKVRRGADIGRMQLGSPRSTHAAGPMAVVESPNIDHPADGATGSIRQGYTTGVINSAQKLSFDGFQRKLAGTEAVNFVLFDQEGPAKLGDAAPPEAIIIADAITRPAYLVCSNTLYDPVSTAWFDYFRLRQTNIERTLRSTGFISSADLPQGDLGTGFVVAPGVVMTNRHVALPFAIRDGSGWSIRPRLGGTDAARVTINFAKFLPGCDDRQASFQVEEILHIETSSDLDVAILRVRTTNDAGDQFPAPLPLADDSDRAAYAQGLSGVTVYAAGYPFADYRNSFLVQREIFGNVFEVKRVAPGQLTKDSSADAFLFHDCSTLGGNSGSPITDIDSGKVVGLHFAGEYLDKNWAVPIWRLLANDGVRTSLQPAPREASGRTTKPYPSQPEPPQTGTPESPPAEAVADVNLVRFDENGGWLELANFDRLLQQNESAPPTDVFILAHGWNNSEVEATNSYRRILAVMGDVADRRQLRPAGYRPLVLGVRWPSKSWTGEGVPNESPPKSLAPRESVEAATGELASNAAIVAAVAENFPPDRAPAVEYSRDKLSMQRILSQSKGTPDDFAEMIRLFRRYSIDSAFAEDQGVFDDLLRGGAQESPVAPSRLEGLFDFSPLDVFRTFTYWQMKARAGIVGGGGVRQMLVRVQQAFPSARVHLFGHSFGAKVMLSAIADPDRPRLGRAVDTLVLVQPAISHESFASQVTGANRPGGYRLAVTDGRVSGPIVVTYSRLDTALGTFYPLASRVAGQGGDDESVAVSRYSALGGVGAFGVDDTKLNMGDEASTTYGFRSGLYSVNGGEPQFISEHSGFYNKNVGWLIWSAILRR